MPAPTAGPAGGTGPAPRGSGRAHQRSRWDGTGLTQSDEHHAAPRVRVWRGLGTPAPARPCSQVLRQVPQGEGTPAPFPLPGRRGQFHHLPPKVSGFPSSRGAGSEHTCTRCVCIAGHTHVHLCVAARTCMCSAEHTCMAACAWLGVGTYTAGCVHIRMCRAEYVHGYACAQVQGVRVAMRVHGGCAHMHA